MPAAQQPTTKTVRRSRKPTAAQSAMRVAKVEEQLLDGLSRAEIVRYSTKTWGIVPRATDNLIAQATVSIENVLKVERDAHRATTIRRYERLYAKSVKAKDLNCARNCLSDLSRLLSLAQIDEANGEAAHAFAEKVRMDMRAAEAATLNIDGAANDAPMDEDT